MTGHISTAKSQCLVPEIPERLIEIVEQHWRSPKVVVIGAVAIALFVFFYSITSISWQYASLYALSMALIFVIVWATIIRLPRVPKGKIGFIVAIHCENDDTEKKIRADFVDSIRELLRRDVGIPFCLVEFPRAVARQIVEDTSRGTKLLTRVGGHFMLYGRVRERKIKGRPTHLLDLEGLVRHKKTSAETTRDLALDFSQVLPRKFMVDVEDDVLTLEVAANLTELAARYVVAYAAYISGAIAFAEKLLLDVEGRVSQVEPMSQLLGGIGQKVPRRLITLYETWVAVLYRHYWTTRETSILITLDEVVAKLLDRQPRHYSGLLAKAICDFMLRRDVDGAKTALKKCHRQDDVAWLYGVAFLEAYSGDLQKAKRAYEKAFKGRVMDVTVPVQSEEFIQIILDAEPTAVQLYYCAGLINYLAKNDEKAAIKDFQAFVESVAESDYPHQVAEARKIINRIQEGD